MTPDMEATRSPDLNQQRWQLLISRSRDTDGHFFYGVKTTGIFCRQGCTSRLPNRENVVFFDTIAQASDAGFRPCKRCHPLNQIPDSNLSELITGLCRRIETSETEPRLDDLASGSGYSQHHLQKIFKKTTGLTPRQYAEACRFKLLRQTLQGASSVTGAIYEAGFGSNRQAYEKAAQELGMSPETYRRGAPGQKILVSLFESPLGTLIIAATETGICALDIGDRPEELIRGILHRFPQAHADFKNPRLKSWQDHILEYFNNPHKPQNLPLDIKGTSFQKSVWRSLAQIPCGQTRTYSNIALEVGSPGAARAVATACASNPVALLIPCHRAVRRDGSPTPYRWGKPRKIYLLNFEQHSDNF